MGDVRETIFELNLLVTTPISGVTESKHDKPTGMVHSHELMETKVIIIRRHRDIEMARTLGPTMAVVHIPHHTI
jgi:hypothetical protein